MYKSDLSLFIHTLRTLMRAPSLNLKSKVKFVVLYGLFFRRLNPFLGAMHTRSLEGLLTLHPRLITKALRPYGLAHLSIEERVSLLTGQITCLHQIMGQERLFKHYQQGVEVCAWTMAENRYNVRFQYCHQHEKEGEVTFYLDADQRPLFSATFLVFADHLLISSFQGRRDRGEPIKLFTKQNHGLRPQSFLILMCQVFAKAWGFEDLRALKSAHHVYQADPKLKDRMVLDYDALWEEHNGTEFDERSHSLPLEPNFKPIEEVSSHKRSMYRKRYELLDRLMADCQTLLAAQCENNRATAQRSVPVGNSPRVSNSNS